MLNVKEYGNDYIVYLKGRIDNHEGKVVETDIVRLVEKNKNANLILNLSDVEYLSSSGIRIFLSTQRLLKANGKDQFICEITEAVAKILRAAKVYDYLNVVGTESEAKDLL